MKVEYSSNNSGGLWWLEDKDWFALEQAGWKVRWVKDEQDPLTMLDEGGARWLGALATKAVREGLSLKEAVAEWETITGQSADREGCECCGRPHSFYKQR